MEATPANASTFEVIFVIRPSGPFGVPENGVTVVPAGTEVVSAAIDTWSGLAVGNGTLPQYRTKPIEAELSAAGASLRLQDNFLSVTVSATNDGGAFSSAKRVAGRFCMALTMRAGRYFESTLCGGCCVDTQTPLKLPQELTMLSVCSYNLPALRTAIGQMSGLLGTADEMLERSMSYFYHGVFLHDSLNQSEDSSSFHAYYLLSEAILNFYKSVSVIVGDPSCGDKHQSQYKRYKLGRDLWERTEKVRTARNKMDVAHYRAEPEQFAALQAAATDARKTATEVVDAYLAWLREANSSADV